MAAAEIYSSPPSRINFMFFSSTNLFQVSSSDGLEGDSNEGWRHTWLTPGLLQKEQQGQALNSYVVASSVGNLSVQNLEEPVQIHIAHMDQQVE